MNIFFVIALIAGIGVLLYILYDLIIVEKLKKKKGKLVRILLYEKVHKSLVFKGQKVGEEMNDDTLGVYIFLRGEKKAIDRVKNEDFDLDKEYGKCLRVVKYSDDDYRPFVRLQNETWFRKREVYQQACDEETGEGLTETINTDDGEVQRPIMETIINYEEYNEPLGISQDHREAARFNLKHRQHLKEKFAKKLGLLDKILLPMAFVTMAFILFLSFSYMSSQQTQAIDKISANFGVEVENLQKATQDPLFAEKLMDKIQRKEKEENGPPK